MILVLSNLICVANTYRNMRKKIVVNLILNQYLRLKFIVIAFRLLFGCFVISLILVCYKSDMDTFMHNQLSGCS